MFFKFLFLCISNLIETYTDEKLKRETYLNERYIEKTTEGNALPCFIAY